MAFLIPNGQLADWRGWWFSPEEVLKGELEVVSFPHGSLGEVDGFDCPDLSWKAGSDEIDEHGCR